MHDSLSQNLASLPDQKCIAYFFKKSSQQHHNIGLDLATTSSEKRRDDNDSDGGQEQERSIRMNESRGEAITTTQRRSSNRTSLNTYFVSWGSIHDTTLMITKASMVSVCVPYLPFSVK